MAFLNVNNTKNSFDFSGVDWNQADVPDITSNLPEQVIERMDAPISTRQDALDILDARREHLLENHSNIIGPSHAAGNPFASNGQVGMQHRLSDQQLQQELKDIARKEHTIEHLDAIEPFYFEPLAGIGGLAVGLSKMAARKTLKEINFSIDDIPPNQAGIEFDVDEFRLNEDLVQYNIVNKHAPEGWQTYLQTMSKQPTLSSEYNVNTGSLNIGSINVPQDMRQQGIAVDMVKQAIQAVGEKNVKSIKGNLHNVNAAEYEKAIKAGLSPQEAIKQTPAYQIREKLGYTHHRFDPQSMMLESFKPVSSPSLLSGSAVLGPALLSNQEQARARGLTTEQLITEKNALQDMINYVDDPIIQPAVSPFSSIGPTPGELQQPSLLEQVGSFGNDIWGGIEKSAQWLGDTIETAARDFHGDDWDQVVKEARARGDVIDTTPKEGDMTFSEAWNGIKGTFGFGDDKEIENKTTNTQKHEGGENHGAMSERDQEAIDSAKDHEPAGYEGSAP